MKTLRNLFSKNNEKRSGTRLKSDEKKKKEKNEVHIPPLLINVGALIALGIVALNFFSIANFVLYWGHKIYKGIAAIPNILLSAASSALPYAASIGAGLAGAAGAYYGYRKTLDVTHRKSIENNIETACDTKNINKHAPIEIGKAMEKARSAASKRDAPRRKTLVDDYVTPKELEKTLAFFKEERDFILAKNQEIAHLQVAEYVIGQYKYSAKRENQYTASLKPRPSPDPLFNMSDSRYNKQLRRAKNRHIQKSYDLRNDYKKTGQAIAQDENILEKELSLFTKEQRLLEKGIAYWTNDTKFDRIYKKYKSEFCASLVPITSDELTKKRSEIYKEAVDQINHIMAFG